MSPAIKPNYHQTPLDEVQARTRVDDEGHVYVLPTSEGAEEAHVGQFSAGDADAALQYFTRKFDDLYNRALLLRARVATHADTAGSLRTSQETLSKELEAGTWVGDVPALRAILKEIGQGIDGITDEEKKKNDEVVKAKIALREEIVQAAEELAAVDPDRQHWKSAQERMNELFEQWKTEQRTPPRLSKSQEDPLWKRFREARISFERHRKAFFVRRDKEAAEVKRAKEELITEAEKLQHSTDFGPTTKAYHGLMDRWKELGRGPRKTEDAQWTRFRAAQDVFFSARDASNAKVDAEYAENLKKKEEILSKLHDLMPFTKPEAVRERYLSLLSTWDAAGKVPRADIKRMERSIGEVQDAFREAEGATRSPRESAKNDRQSEMIGQLEETIAQLESERDQAKAAGDDKRTREAEEALAARRSWLQMLTSS